MSDDYECSLDLTKAIDWQRSTSTTTKALIESKQDWYQENFCDPINDWVTDVFTLETATDFGLAVWAKVLDIDLYSVSTSIDSGASTWGFGSFHKNFGRGNFYDGSGNTEEFTTEQKRIMVKLKAFILNFPNNTPAINERLASIFGEGVIYVLDGLDMSYTYIVDSTDIESFVSQLEDKDLLPKPTGISIGSVRKLGASTWGFGSSHKNFSNGNFFNGEI